VPKNPKFIFTIDHLDDQKMSFFGWLVEDRNDEFTLYRRHYDGEQVVVQNESPRWFVTDDVNDAEQMSSGVIIIGPEGRREER